MKGFVIVIRASSSTSKFILIVMENKELMHFQISSVIALSLSLSLSLSLRPTVESPAGSILHREKIILVSK